ncbi:hypothetical protein SDC9_177732 [bioreactor metagenome]|uniref:Uncharacterized protein n=1 Tax=bioreactor metagenome TaxID=1076179 RepID=A0A645GWX6_9ZZZZ
MPHERLCQILQMRFPTVLLPLLRPLQRAIKPAPRLGGKLRARLRHLDEPARGNMAGVRQFFRFSGRADEPAVDQIEVIPDIFFCFALIHFALSPRPQYEQNCECEEERLVRRFPGQFFADADKPLAKRVLIDVHTRCNCFQRVSVKIVQEKCLPNLRRIGRKFLFEPRHRLAK